MSEKAIEMALNIIRRLFEKGTEAEQTYSRAAVAGEAFATALANDAALTRELVKRGADHAVGVIMGVAIGYLAALEGQDGD